MQSARCLRLIGRICASVVFYGVVVLLCAVRWVVRSAGIIAENRRASAQLHLFCARFPVFVRLVLRLRVAQRMIESSRARSARDACVQEPCMPRRVLDIVSQSNDANLGATLIRLARLAETAHAYESALRGLTADVEVRFDNIQAPPGKPRGNGLHPMPVVQQPKRPLPSSASVPGMRCGARCSEAHPEVEP